LAIFLLLILLFWFMYKNF